MAPRSAPAPPRRWPLRCAARPSPSCAGPATPTSPPRCAPTPRVRSRPSPSSASPAPYENEKTLPNRLSIRQLEGRDDRGVVRLREQHVGGEGRGLVVQHLVV